MDTHFLNLKLQPWPDWSDWLHVFQLLIGNTDPNSLENRIETNLLEMQNPEKVSGNLKRALHIINSWLTKNVGSGEHIKALKM